MKNWKEYKNGFTMIELLVVVTIIGILSSMGVVSLHGAVVNNRIKDAAVNVTAYLERVASETNRLSQKVCVRVSDNKKTLFAFKGDCAGDEGDRISEYSLEGALVFQLTKGCDKWFDKGELFEPRIGLSAAPIHTCLIAKYGDTDKYAKAEKNKEKNNLIPRVSYDSGSSWTDL